MILSLVALIGPLTAASANHPAGSELDCEPEGTLAGDINPTGEEHQITCELVDAAGDPVTAQPAAVTVNGEIDCVDADCTGATYDGGATGNPLDGDLNDTPTNGDQVPPADDDDRSDPDGSCVIPQGQSACTFSYDRNDAGTDEITFSIAGHGQMQDEAVGDVDQDHVDAVQKVWQDRTATTVNCAPDETNQTGTQHTATCTTQDQFGDPMQGAPGPTASDPNNISNNETCDATTDANGQGDCTFTNNGTPGTITTTQCTGPGGTGTCDSQVKTFQAGTASGLDAEPETDTNTVGQQHQITCSVFNQFGNQPQGTNAQTCNFEFFTGSPSDQDGNTPNTPDRACTTDANGNCTITYTSNTAGTDLVCVWLGGTTAAMTGDNTNGTCGGEGLTDADDDNTGADAPDPANDDQDVVQKIWQAGAGPATQINAEPETDTNPRNTQHIIRVFAGSANNQPTTATNIRADILPGSANQANQTTAEIQCTADNVNEAGNQNTFTGAAAGQTQTHECAYTGANAGTDTVRVFADTNGNNIFDQGEPFDDVTKIWSAAAFAVQLTPDTDTQTAGICNEFTVRVTDAQGNPVVGEIVDVEQVLQGAGTEPGESRELSFCTPTNPQGANPVTGQTNLNQAPTANGPTQFGDVSGNNPGGTAGQQGTNTTVHAEVGPTNNNGEVTFGININNVPQGQTATVSVRAWVETDNDDTFEAGEPTDQPSTKTWQPGGSGAVTTLNAEPETATNPIGTTHQVTVTMTGANGPVQGVTPQSIIANNAQGRPAGDVADANAGTSPNAAAGHNPGGFNQYNCTASNAQGVSTCTFSDVNNPGPTGTDTIVFYVNQATGGTPGPDANEPQDAVQKTWTPGPQNLNLDVQCAGTGTNDDQDVAEQGLNEPGAGIPDCTNPLADADEVFTAIVTNAGGIGQQNIRVDFSFGTRTSGNQAGNSADDATLNATPGGQIGTGGNLRTFCLTDATGRCSVTLSNATPVAGDTIEVVGAISGGTGGIPTDGATKQWQTGVVNQGGTITLTPRAATNQVGTQHTVTATVRNQFGQPVQGANVDFRITQGPNAGLSQAGMVDAVTDANGVATFTYTSNATGTDVIMACTETGGTENDQCNAGTGANLNQGAGGEPTATATKTWQTGPVVTNAVALDMDVDEGVGQNVNQSPPGVNNNPPAVGCELTTGGADPNRESTATNSIDPTAGGQLTLSNFHRICAAAFQTNQQGNQGRLAGAQITFTITGPGRIYAANANGQCATNAVPAAGTTVTVTADENGYAFACLYSQQVGRTTVTASSGTPAQTATGTKDWTVSPATARFIQLCHGDIAGTTCETDEATNEPGDEHEMTARVTDAQGNPVAGVSVEFRETGPGIFTPQGGSTATTVTDANGLAAILLTSDVEGTSTVVAEIRSGSGAPIVGGNQNPRGAGAADDECERPAGTNNQPAAGNCISQTLTKIWDDEPIEIPECDDGQDNDGDDFIDEEDPGCVDANDDSELPVNPPVDPTIDRHGRSISIRFNDGTGARNNGLVVFGRLRVGDGFNECRAAQPINVQRRVNGRWVTKKGTTTNRKGRYAVEIFDLASRYRVVAPRTEIVDEDLNHIDVCGKAIKAKRHRHRR